MNAGEIKQMLDAGFTAEEIRGFYAEPEPKKDPEPEPEQKKDPEPEQAASDTARLIEKLTQSITDLDARLKSFSARTTETKGPDAEQSAEEILASIINPTYKKE